MAGYTDLAAMQRRLGDEADAIRLQSVISVAAQDIDDATDRRFDLDAEVSARQILTAANVLCDEPDGEILLVDDIGSLDDLVVEVGDGTTWMEITDFEAGPFDRKPNWPYTELRRLAGWSGHRRARIATRWGWPATPDTISESNEILAERYYRRPEAPWGAAWNLSGMGDTAIARLASSDPDVVRMIRPYVKVRAAF